jgi:hypothetical protein
MMKWIALVLVAAALLGWFARERLFGDERILSGEFRGIQIGSTKSEVLTAISRLGSVGSVLGVQSNYAVIGGLEAERLNELIAPELLNLTDGLAQMTLVFENLRLSKIRQVSAARVTLAVSEGQTWEEVRSSLVRYLLDHSGSYIQTGLPGFGPNNNQYEVLLSSIVSEDNDGRNWLLNQDQWLFHERDSYSYANLTFQGGRLVEIVFTQRTWEWPW